MGLSDYYLTEALNDTHALERKEKDAIYLSNGSLPETVLINSSSFFGFHPDFNICALNTIQDKDIRIRS